MEHGWHPNLHPGDESRTHQYPIREAIGCLAHIANHTRPDISFAVSRLQREMHKPTYSCVLALERIMKYLAYTRNLGLTFTKQAKETASTALTSYADATWGGWEDDIETTLKSTSGFVHIMNGGPISWGSKLQRGKPAQSSGEAEYIAAYHAITDTLYLKNILMDLSFQEDNQPMICYSDSEACIGMSKNPINHKNNKHIMTKYHWVRITVDQGEAKILKVHTNDNPADLFTKTIRTVKQFEALRSLVVS